MLPVKGSPTTRNGTLLVLANDRGLEHGPADFEDVPGSEDHTGILDELEAVFHESHPVEETIGAR